jgi:hypothetical protein
VDWKYLRRYRDQCLALLDKVMSPQCTLRTRNFLTSSGSVTFPRRNPPHGASSKLNTDLLLQTHYSEYSIYKSGCILKINENVFVLSVGVSGRLFTCSIHPSKHRLSGSCLLSRPGSITNCLCAYCDSQYAFCHEALSGLCLAFRTILVLIWDSQPGFYRR